MNELFYAFVLHVLRAAHPLHVEMAGLSFAPLARLSQYTWLYVDGEKQRDAHGRKRAYCVSPATSAYLRCLRGSARRAVARCSLLAAVR